MDTGTSWKFQEYTLKSEPKEKHRGMMPDPLYTIGVPSAVRRQTPLVEVEFGPGNTETEAPESKRNSLSEKISQRKKREEHQILSGTGAETGTGTGPAGWLGASTCRTTSFPNPSTASCS